LSREETHVLRDGHGRELTHVLRAEGPQTLDVYIYDSRSRSHHNMSATPTHDTTAPEQQDEVPKQQKKQKKNKRKYRKNPDPFYGYPGEEDSYDEFEVNRSDPEDAEAQDAEAQDAEAQDAEPKDAKPKDTKPKLPEFKLPVVASYELDLPKGKKARARFDAEVDAMCRRIWGSYR